MSFLVIARDGTDPDAPARRQQVREQHLKEALPLLQDGTIEYAGAFLAADGTMRGSLLVIRAADEAEVRALLARDIYSRSGVWQELEISEFRRFKLPDST
jgi:uncharacterized protein YciI